MSRSAHPRGKGPPALSGRQKAGVLLLALGPELAGAIFQFLTEEEVEALSLEIADLHVITKETRTEVLAEFYELAIAQEYISKGGLRYAKDLLESAMGANKASEVLRRVQLALERRDFQLLRNVDPGQLVNFIKNEHPQTISLILSHLESRQAAEILRRLNEDVQVEVGYRVATMEPVPPETVHEVERMLEKRTQSLSLLDSPGKTGIDTMVNILVEADRPTEKRILEGIEGHNSQVATDIRNRMFVFEDVNFLDDRSIQRLLKEIEASELTLALKAASEELRTLFFKNMSSRASQALGEDLEVMGPVRLRTVEEAQQKIVAMVRKLEDEGEIAAITRGSGGDEFVF